MFSAQQELATGSQLSFSDPFQRISYSFDEIEYDAWAERIKGGYSFSNRSDGHEFGPWTRGVQQSFSFYSSPAKGEFWWPMEEDDCCEFMSPPLWKKPGSPPSDDYDNHDKHPLHNSQERAITSYQQVPGSIYELSMRDLIELPKIMNSKREAQGTGGAMREEQMKVKKVKKGFSRSISLDNGVFLLKIFFPKSLSGRRKSFGPCSSSPTGPTKPPQKDMEIKLEKSIDGTEWKRNELGNLSRSDNSSRRMRVCCPFCNISINKRKAREPEGGRG